MCNRVNVYMCKNGPTDERVVTKVPSLFLNYYSCNGDQFDFKYIYGMNIFPN